MKIAFWPFFSQQNKRVGKFSLGSDSGVRLYAHCASEAAKAGWDATLVLPDWSQCDSVAPGFAPARALRLAPGLPVDNLQRRLHWDTAAIRRVCEGIDVVCTQHQHLAYPIRKLFPELRVLTECGMRPEQAYDTVPLFELAYRASDLVHCNSAELDSMVSARFRGVRTTVWPFGVDDALLSVERLPIAYDVAFPARASSTGYTNHELFLEAMRFAPQLRTLMTDPTGYLKLRDHPMHRDQYVRALSASSVVVGLTDNGYGGYSFLEAVALGCVPVALKLPEYESLLGPGWPYYCVKEPGSVLTAVRRALEGGWPEELRPGVSAQLAKHTYSYAWRRAKGDIERLQGR